MCKTCIRPTTITLLNKWIAQEMWNDKKVGVDCPRTTCILVTKQSHPKSHNQLQSASVGTQTYRDQTRAKTNLECNKIWAHIFCCPPTLCKLIFCWHFIPTSKLVKHSMLQHHIKQPSWKAALELICFGVTRQDSFNSARVRQRLTTLEINSNISPCNLPNFSCNPCNQK